MTEKNLIFLISQPRSGSTLTQKIIGSHSEIYTRGEPWLMLPPAYSLKKEGLIAEYDASLQQQAFSIFVEDLPEGEETYINELRKMNLNLYSSYLKSTGYNYFLDKTPRYHLITDELQKIFPNANFILLIRNPLAVLGSMINTWTKDNWDSLAKMKYDLIEAIETNINILDNQHDKYLIIHYEKLISNSEEVFKNIFDYLGLSYESETLNYHNDTNEKWTFGDPSSVYEKKGIDSNNDIKWQKSLDDLQYWRVMYDYLNYIGEEKFTKLGYDFNEHMNILNERMPAKTLDELLVQTEALFSFFDNVDYAPGSITKLNNDIHDLKKSLLEKENKLINIYSSKKWKLISTIAKYKKYITKS